MAVPEKPENPGACGARAALVNGGFEDPKLGDGDPCPLFPPDASQTSGRHVPGGAGHFGRHVNGIGYEPSHAATA
ncbi:hypothetical protein [Bailinhaonella thermotolerans]|uniref:Uncharacterized protein n=1 Tax=Bailinhaonella thermotolerans TaxID=1070861 RepID=A0A3A4AZC6_9ACTN|nr:hypothetical protein [Bailinhaonella thermotolerans]RJL35737.1 hypothetical protein D5H75_02845 [Bailinhaonella thermotolerans]